MHIRPVKFLAAAAMVAALVARGSFAHAQSRPATAPAVDLSSPRAALTRLYESLKAGDISAAKQCLIFADDEQAESFDIAYTQLYAPLALVEKVEKRFGAGAGKAFGLSPVEKSLDALLEKTKSAEIRESGDTAAIADHANVNPSEETELTGITFKKETGRGGAGQWKVVAGTFMSAGGEIPQNQRKFMRALRDGTAAAVAQTSARLARGDFQNAQQAYADYESRLQQATRGAATAATQKGR